MNKLLYLSIFFLFFCLSCQKTKRFPQNPEVLKIDTLQPPSKKLRTAKCEKKVQGFKNKFGIFVSNFYVVSQKIENKKDSILMEFGGIANDDNRKLIKVKKDKIANAIVEAIKEYSNEAF